MTNLAYLVDIFDALNMLNQSLQGRDVAVCGSIAKLKLNFIAKLRLWRGSIQSDTLAMSINLFLDNLEGIEANWFL